MKNYFIKPEYTINQVPITSEKFSEGLYWNADRIRASKLYQYSVYQDAIRLAKEYKVKALCDVGCGTGEKLRLISVAIPELKIVGVDQSHAIDYCLKTHNFGEWIVDDFSDPTSTLQADMTICSDVIEHLVDPDILMSYLKRLTKPGGLILISTPDRDILRGESCISSPNKQHIREWNAKEFGLYLESQGLHVLKHYHAPAVKYSFTKEFIREVLIRVLAGKKANYNQIALVLNQG